MYSQWIVDSGHEYEIDLLVAWPEVGIAAIEVKGGHVERDVQARWRSSRGRTRSEIRHPFVQSSDSRNALQRYLRARGAAAGRVRTQHLLALPHMAIPGSHDPPDCPRSLVLDKDDLARADQLLRSAIEQGEGYAVLDAGALEEMLALFTMQLPSQALLLTMAEEHEQLVDQMTRDQAEVMRCLGQFPRLVVIGGAGTGKTWMALEQAKRITKAGDRVALVCYSRGLGRFLQRMTSTWDRNPAYVGLFHDLALEWGAPPPSDNESDYYEQELPRALGELAGQRTQKDLFDAVIVDEAQDFGQLWWPSLLACLKDPEHGGVFLFLDQAQRVFSRRAEPPISLPPYTLFENIRNTKRIAQVFGSLGQEQGTYNGIDGPMVRFVQCLAREAIDRADEAVEALLEDWEPGQVALLTTKHRHPVQGMAIGARGWQAYWDDFFAEQDVFYGHVLGFKGLERQVVVLAVNGFRDPDRARELLYVGLSRARTQLVVCGDLAELTAVGGEDVRRRLSAALKWIP